MEKVFDFHSLSIIPKKKQQYLLNTKTIPILVRLLEIVEISLELLEKEQIITKRNLYYKLGKNIMQVSTISSTVTLNF